MRSSSCGKFIDMVVVVMNECEFGRSGAQMFFVVDSKHMVAAESSGFCLLRLRTSVFSIA
jgi:hypothetical protein